MAAHVVIVVKDTNATIAQLNAKLGNASTAEKNNLINAVVDYLVGAAMGNVAAGTVEVITRDTDPAVGTSGSGSQEVTVNVG